LPVTLAAGQTATFSVTYAPTTAGSATGSFSLNCNASTANLTVALSGTGVSSGVGSAGHSATISWNASASTNAVGYYVFRSTQSGGPYTQITATPVTSATYTDSNVVAGTTYYYVVTTLDNTGDQSAYSSETAATIP
jgi:fibronectin type 3 domain-containing protein